MVGRAQLALSEVEWGARRHVLAKTACRGLPALPAIRHSSVLISAIRDIRAIRGPRKIFHFFETLPFFFLCKGMN